MALTIFVVITWFALMIFIFLPQKLSFVVNSFVFLVMSIVIKNSFTIIGLNLKWIEANDKSEFFLAYLLYRTIIYPCILLIMINVFMTRNRQSNKLIVLFSGIASLFLIENFGEKLNIYTYKVWNNWFSITEIILFITLTLFVTKFIIYFEKKEETA